jgi:hypothetical protein
MFDGQLTILQLRQELLVALKEPRPDWDFRSSNKCAMGILQRLTNDTSFYKFSADIAATQLGIPGHGSVFVKPSIHGVRHHDKVTQSMVADKLESLFHANLV